MLLDDIQFDYIQDDLSDIYRTFAIEYKCDCVDILLEDLEDFGVLSSFERNDIFFDLNDQLKDELDEVSKRNFIDDYVGDFFQEIKEGAY